MLPSSLVTRVLCPQVTVCVKVEEVTSDKGAPAGDLWEPLDSWVEQPQEEEGRGESPGPQEKPSRVPKEEPTPHEESGSMPGTRQGPCSLCMGSCSVHEEGFSLWWDLQLEGPLSQVGLGALAA